MKLVTQVDSQFLDTAEHELFEILLSQRTAYNERWHSNPLVLKMLWILRVLGLVISIIGMLICLIELISLLRNNDLQIKLLLYFLLFILIFSLFYFLKPVPKFVKNWTHKISHNSCKKLASRCVKQARKHSPYQAEYDLRNTLVTYYRKKDDDWKFAWSRNVEGVAISTGSVTVFFKKKTSIIPKIVILHHTEYQLRSHLAELAIELG